MAHPETTRNHTSQRILVVEDLEDARTTLAQMLVQSLKIPVDTAVDGEDGLRKLVENSYSLVITDLRMPKIDGMAMIAAIREKRIPVSIIVTTGHGSIADAVQAMRHGAYNFLTKPVDPVHLLALVERALQERLLQDEVFALREQLGERHRFRGILSKSPCMADVFELVSQVADSNSTVLITGETGTGKELIARAIHEASAVHRDGPMVAVNCAAIPESLLESELFGHEKGSFTGAISQRKGRFELAHTGTLFLDEIGDFPSTLQVKLLRVLQERRIERVGGSTPIEIDVRLVTATHRDLLELVRAGTFREDLYYRLNVIQIELPPLRDRLEDVPLLANYFVQKYRRANTEPVISAAAMESLLAASWPGNIRQLENAIERACVTCRDDEILPKHLPPDVARHAVRSVVPSLPGGESAATEVATVPTPNMNATLTQQLAQMTAAFEEKFIRAALKKTRGNVGLCAEICGLSRRSITEKLHQYNIEKADYKTIDD